MYYEDNRRRRPRRRRRSLLGILIGFLLKLFIILAIIAIIIYAIPVSIFMIEGSPEFSPSGGLKSSDINILLLGVDKLNSGTQRSDTMMVASVGYSSLKLTSIMRDTQVAIPDHSMNKINAAYAFGGSALAVRTVNENFGLNITKYAVIDFASLAVIINAVGGVDIAITQAEVAEINKNVKDTWHMFKKLGYAKTATGELSVSFANPDENGRVVAHLDGFQALGYARIRHIDSDYARTYRQRKLLNALVSRVRSKWYDPISMVRLVKAVSKGVDTNLNAFEILSLGLKAVTAKDIPQSRLPVDNSYTDNGSSLTNVDFKKNHDAFIEFVYGD